LVAGSHVLELKEKFMFTHISRSLVALALISAAALPARAQLAVIDIPAIVQLIQEVQTMQQQVQTAEAQLAQAKQALQIMTGDRGMQLLLNGISRNYLPSSWSQLTSAMQGGAGGFPELSADIQRAMLANSVLSSQQLSILSAAAQKQILAGRQSSALQQALSQEALTNASGRFVSIQSLIDAISTAADQKAILDLQARINAELGMLQNEQTKLQILNQATQAQESVDRQQVREQIIAGHGSFASRFQPTPAAPVTTSLQ
jgi:type IV secretion system protein VirB5